MRKTLYYTHYSYLGTSTFSTTSIVIQPASRLILQDQEFGSASQPNPTLLKPNARFRYRSSLCIQRPNYKQKHKYKPQAECPRTSNFHVFMYPSRIPTFLVCVRFMCSIVLGSYHHRRFVCLISSCRSLISRFILACSATRLAFSARSASAATSQTVSSHVSVGSVYFVAQVVNSE